MAESQRHSPENHTVVLEWYWKPQSDRSDNEPFRPVQTADRVVVEYLDRRGSTDREPMITQWCRRCQTGSPRIRRCKLPQSGAERAEKRDISADRADQTEKKQLSATVLHEVVVRDEDRSSRALELTPSTRGAGAPAVRPQHVEVRVEKKRGDRGEVDQEAAV